MASSADNPGFQMKALLDGFVERDEDDRTLFFHLFEALGAKVIGELGNRLIRPSTSGGLKLLILEAARVLPHEEWTPILLRALRHESDLYIFDAGCLALGTQGTEAAIQALRELALIRLDPPCQASLMRELEKTDPHEAFLYHFQRLMEGSENPKTALSAAEHLPPLAGIYELPLLEKACQHPDILVSRLALQVVGQMPLKEAADFVLAHFRTCHETIMEDRALVDLAHRCRPLKLAEALEDLLASLVAALPQGIRVNLSLLRAMPEEGLPEAVTYLETLRPLIVGPLANLALDLLQAFALGKPGLAGGYSARAVDGVHRRAPQFLFILNRAADALYQRVCEGLLDGDAVLAQIRDSFRHQTGGPPVARVFASLLDPRDTASLELVLANGDSNLRSAALMGLGDRREPSLLAFFMKAIEDPIQEIGLAAMEQLHKLPGSFLAVLDALHSPHPDRVRLALRIFGHNRVVKAGESILLCLEAMDREDMEIEALVALRQIGYAPALPLYLKRLHPGASPRLQVALGENLKALGTEEALSALGARAMAHKSASLRLLALEGWAQRYDSFHDPLPSACTPLVMDLLDACFVAREGWPHRYQALVILGRIYVQDSEFYESMRRRALACLEDKTRKNAWTIQMVGQVTTVVRELGSRAANLVQSRERQKALPALLEAVPPGGGQRGPALRALRTWMEDRSIILAPEHSDLLRTFLCEELFREDEAWENLQVLCEIAGRFGHPGLVSRLHRLLLWAAEMPLESAVRVARAASEALGDLKVDEGRREAMPRVGRLLFLDPSAFYRKRILEPIQLHFPDLEILSLASRQEAAQALREPVDIIVSELQDGEGDLMSWFQAQWGRRACRIVIVSTAHRASFEPNRAPWIRAVLQKPYPPQQLLDLLQTLAQS